LNWAPRRTIHQETTGRKKTWGKNSLGPFVAAMTGFKKKKKRGRKKRRREG